MFDHVPSKENDGCGYVDKDMTFITVEIEATKSRITCRVCPLRSYLYMWENTSVVVLLDKCMLLLAYDVSYGHTRANKCASRELTRQLVEFICDASRAYFLLPSSNFPAEMRLLRSLIAGITLASYTLAQDLTPEVSAEKHQYQV
jgi:hypothetical protein